MKKLILIMAITITSNSYADNHFCYETGVTYESVDPCKAGHEVNRPYSSRNYYRYPRYESNELIDKPKREEAEKQRKWDSLKRSGVTPYNSPNTYFNTRFSQR